MKKLLAVFALGLGLTVGSVAATEPPEAEAHGVFAGYSCNVHRCYSVWYYRCWEPYRGYHLCWRHYHPA